MANEVTNASFVTNGGRTAEVLAGIVQEALYDPTDVRSTALFVPWVAAGSATLEALVDGGLLAVVKLGSAGALAGDGSLRWGVPSVPADARDTTGAGDAFAAGFLASWTRDRDVEEALRLATRLAARAVTLQGGRP